MSRIIFVCFENRTVGELSLNLANGVIMKFNLVSSIICGFMVHFAYSVGVCSDAKAPPAKQKKSAKCTVDGHGPYDMTFSKCLYLGTSQAHTNCVLKSQDANVELQFLSDKKTKIAKCYSKFQAKTEDCQKAQCIVQGD